MNNNELTNELTQQNQEIGN